MASVNKVILIGNCGRDPEIRTTTSGDSVANVSIATTEKFKDRNSGELRENTEWHRLVFYGRLAEIVGQYVKKGSPIYVEGKIRTRKWQDQNTGQERYMTEIYCDQLTMLGSRRDMQTEPFPQGEAPMPAGPSSSPQQPKPVPSNDLEDDIPF